MEWCKPSRPVSSALERLQEVLNGKHRWYRWPCCAGRCFNSACLYGSASSTNLVRHHLQRMARQHGYVLMPPHPPHPPSSRSSWIPVFYPLQDGLPRHHGDLLLVGRAVPPGGGAAAVRRGGECEADPARRVSYCT